jgi:hypothetical protein
MTPDLVQRLQMILRLRGAGKLLEADAGCKAALAVYPDQPGVLTLAAVLSAQLGRLDEALGFHQKILERAPTPEAWNNYAAALKSAGRLDEAAEAWRRAIALRPDYPIALSGLALLLSELREFDEALRLLDAQIGREPADANAHVTRAMILLLLGRYPEGWRDWEWRWKCTGFQEPAGNFAAPAWDGGPLNGRTLLLHAERGFGDCIQMARYAPLIAAHNGGSRVFLETPQQLVSLFRSFEGVAGIVERGTPRPAFDVHAPLMSLPHLLGTMVETIPATIPYLHADPARRIAWEKRLARSAGHVNVGLVWAGTTNHPRNSQRSLRFEELSPLLSVGGVSWYSLQIGPPAGERAASPLGARVVPLDAELTDFAETAAALSAMDLLITVDTSVAHLGGAMGVRTWMFVPYAPDFRWMLDRSDTPWYPTMTLFREQSWGERLGVIRRMADALSAGL